MYGSVSGTAVATQSQNNSTAVPLKFNYSIAHSNKMEVTFACTLYLDTLHYIGLFIFQTILSNRNNTK